VLDADTGAIDKEVTMTGKLADKIAVVTGGSGAGGGEHSAAMLRIGKKGRAAPGSDEPTRPLAPIPIAQ
jgi:hypothetical protein